MKIIELIKKLESYPQDAKVVAPGYEGGLDDITDVKYVFIKPNANIDIWYEGLHAQVDEQDPGAEKVVKLETSRR